MDPSKIAQDKHKHRHAFIYDLSSVTTLPHRLLCKPCTSVKAGTKPGKMLTYQVVLVEPHPKLALMPSSL